MYSCCTCLLLEFSNNALWIAGLYVYIMTMWFDSFRENKKVEKSLDNVVDNHIGIQECLLFFKDP